MTPEYDDIKLFLQSREEDVHNLICLCEKSKVDIAVHLKSSIILLMYNIIEGSFSRINEEIFDYIFRNNIEIESLPKEIKRVYFEYYKNVLSNVDKLMDFYSNKSITLLSYKELTDKVRFFSGNLDAKAIRDFSKKKIGIKDIKTRRGTQMVVVKNIRNKLAHGEITYQEATRNIKLSKLMEICKDCFEFMYAVVERYDKFYEHNIISLAR